MYGASSKAHSPSTLAAQVRNAAEEYHAEFAAKEATIAALGVDAEAARARMQAEIEKLRTEMEARPPAHWLSPAIATAGAVRHAGGR
jgi:phosphopantetheinyl transferase (holo-ACP synthase)